MIYFVLLCMASVRLHIAHSLTPPIGALQVGTLENMLTYIKEGGRLDCPENCPPEVYEIMKTCWYERPEDRPTFKALLKMLKTLPPSDDHVCYPTTTHFNV